VPRACPTCGAPFVLEKKSVRRGTEHVCAREGCEWREPVEGAAAGGEKDEAAPRPASRRRPAKRV
jgi:DNA topoisomerase-1